MKRGAELHTSILPNLLDYSYTWFTNFIPLSTNHKQWSNALKQFVGNLPKNCLSVLTIFVGLALKGLCLHTYAEKWMDTKFKESFVGNNGQSSWPYTFFVYRSVTVHTCNIFFPYQFDFGESLQKVKIENAI